VDRGFYGCGPLFFYKEKDFDMGEMKYLRQLKSGHIYAWTPALAQRGDMVVYDDETALSRIKALKSEISRKRDIIEGLGQGTAENAKKDADLAALLDQLETTSETLGDTIRNRASKALGQDGEEDSSEMAPDSSDTVEEAQEKQKKLMINEDSEVQLIKGLANKNQIIEHVLRMYGIEMDRSQTFLALKKQAVELRSERMSESIMK